jgi:hypothetical protein
LFDTSLPAEAIQTRGRKNDGIVLARLKLAQARVDIAAQRVYVEVRTHGPQLRFTPQTAGSDPSSLGQSVYGGIANRTQRIAGILPRRNRSYFEIADQVSGQVLQAMNCKVDMVCCERFLDLFGKHPFCSHLGEGNVGDLVAGGVNDLDLNLVTALAQE